MSQCHQSLKSNPHFQQTAVAIRGIGGPVSASVLRLPIALIMYGEQTKISKHHPLSHPDGALRQFKGLI